MSTVSEVALKCLIETRFFFKDLNSDTELVYI